MIAAITIPLILLTALGSALMAGTFFAFSNFVMPALGKLPAEQGLAAMQSINRVVLNPLFLSVFVGTAVAAAILAAGVIVSGVAAPASAAGKSTSVTQHDTGWG